MPTAPWAKLKMPDVVYVTTRPLAAMAYTAAVAMPTTVKLRNVFTLECPQRAVSAQDARSRCCPCRSRPSSFDDVGAVEALAVVVLGAELREQALELAVLDLHEHGAVGAACSHRGRPRRGGRRRPTRGSSWPAFSTHSRVISPSLGARLGGRGEQEAGGERLHGEAGVLPVGNRWRRGSSASCSVAGHLSASSKGCAAMRTMSPSTAAGPDASMRRRVVLVGVGVDDAVVALVLEGLGELRHVRRLTDEADGLEVLVDAPAGR